MKVLAITNQKGGVGKTTTAVNMACYLAGVGYRILFIDLDPQANATGVLLSREDDDSSHAGTYDLLLGANVSEVIQDTILPNLKVIAANTDLAGAEIELVSAMAREFRLAEAIKELHQIDLVIMDTPPTLGLLTINALTAADGVLVPVQSEYFALEGLTKLLGTITLVKDRLNPSLALEGLVLTMYDKRNNLCQQIADELRSHFAELTFKTVVPRNIKLAEAASHGDSIFTYQGQSSGAIAYQNLSEEYISRYPLESVQSSVSFDNESAYLS